ncbi:tRNA uridine-5-carboxymethylaminomethyl(34) synthesis GTPase MnmE [Brytella acorum]|uniref:tRNA modification GTPase MnmE n=1 Tax=Brytella acorum TaxID=2959299 RepID=A0AA35UGX1_9PROT|nr:tRNA uridine-5-carboxymethylaminomethyl(34) synthesis GTPase MnmE [Brytella acorum]MDF3625043.1 tRNA uridine-5-carboxymethylaminomethyl(34) synthesis GTPase MnmE [Brytella acorum]CAI9121078.1 tRNA uridine-5-carboxymethylaminomethyl(34) synthesis GTPase MnmE [Brytella acorum]
MTELPMFSDLPAPIFALATGMGRAAIAVMRVSGGGCDRILRALCAGRLPQPRRASLRRLMSGDEILDEAVVLWFPGPNAYTGEDSFELHLHAGPAVIDGVALALTTLGARPAEPGEFTRRAVQAGRMDLLQAEAVADLIEAESASQRRQALHQADGALSRLYDGWAQRLRRLLAQHEALIDFPDETLSAAVEGVLETERLDLQAEMRAHLADHRGELVRRGVTIVIAGEPNAGKSSLLNALSGYDAAIVTHRPGTTRDVIAVDWVLDGIKLRLVDTAGLRETEDEIEAEGIRRAMFHVKQADIVLQLYEGDPPNALTPDALLVRNKIDQDAMVEESVLAISAINGDGLDALRDEVRRRVRALMASQGVPLTRARHRAGIQEALAHLERAGIQVWPELRGEEFRLSMRALGRLTGQVDVESLLDVIFSQFCIGK